MQFIGKNIQWIMLICGLFTCTMVFAFIAPQMALELTFGQSLQGALAEIIVRSWGAIITLIGAMLIYGAYSVKHRNLTLVVAAVSKLIFIGLVLSIGNQYLEKAALTIAFDGAMAVVFILYLLGPKSQSVDV